MNNVPKSNCGTPEQSAIHFLARTDRYNQSFDFMYRIPNNRIGGTYVMLYAEASLFLGSDSRRVESPPRKQVDIQRDTPD